MRLLRLAPKTITSMTDKVGAATRQVAAASGSEIAELSLGASQSGRFARTLTA